MMIADESAIPLVQPPSRPLLPASDQFDVPRCNNTGCIEERLHCWGDGDWLFDANFSFFPSASGARLYQYLDNDNSNNN